MDIPRTFLLLLFLTVALFTSTFAAPLPTPQNQTPGTVPAVNIGLQAIQTAGQTGEAALSGASVATMMLSNAMSATAGQLENIGGVSGGGGGEGGSNGGSGGGVST